MKTIRVLTIEDENDYQDLLNVLGRESILGHLYNICSKADRVEIEDELED